MLPPSENEVVEAIAALLHESREPTWAEAALEIAFADGFSQLRTWSREAYDGQWEPAPRYAVDSESFAELAATLRRLMYRADRGTWFSARITVTDQGDYRADYDFDNQPNFDPPVSPELFLKDLRQFPREPSRVPSWVGEA